ncbi:MerR family transcriptional regulator [Streptomyces sp. NPDC029674]|uniref:MerR family transcriptional regulator n=1 Tax=Streptomyces sp. NPDC029674 TaxID=3365297 RepID=UPI00384FBF89
MFTIGDFARHGRVSVRMLRHYDAVGLLRPAHVDPSSGYRHYRAAQLARLHRVLALKDLGFTLDQVRSILDEDVSTEELRGMLRLRRAELETAAAEAAARLTRVEARLRTIESEGTMPAEDVVVTSLPPVRAAELTDTAASYAPQDIGPVVGRLFTELCRRLDAAGVTPAGPGIARYEEAPGEEAPGEDRITVRAAIPVADGTAADGLPVVEVPGVPLAATIIHHGSMDGVVSTAHALDQWIAAHSYEPVGLTREVSLDCPDDPAAWVTELQQPLIRRGQR